MALQAVTGATNTLDQNEWLTRCGFDPDNAEKVCEAVFEFFVDLRTLPSNYIAEHSIRCSNGKLSFASSSDQSQEKLEIILRKALEADMSPKDRGQFNRIATKIYTAYGWEWKA